MDTDESPRATTMEILGGLRSLFIKDGLLSGGNSAVSFLQLLFGLK